MRVALPDWTALGLFAGMVLAVTLYGITVAAHFPAASRRASLQEGAGRLIFWGSIAAAVLVSMLALRFALTALPGYAAVIAGGAAILVAPLVLKPLPDAFVDGHAGLVTFAGLGMLLALIARAF